MESELRLSGETIPSKYELSLDVDLERFEYKGAVKIQAVQHTPAKSVRLHAVELEILECKLCCDGATLSCTEAKLDAEKQFLELEFAETVPVGDVTLEISFQSVLNVKMEGFYRANYGNGRYMASTHFEPTDARRAFPCFDEPAMRAQFELTMCVQEDRSCVSNMPIREESVHEGRRKICFEVTPPMPTYLIAFIAGDLESNQSSTKRGLPIEVITKPGDKPLGNFALQTAVQCVDFFEDFFHVEYPLPKMSLVAVPDFPIGAMENWGCITFREVAILSDDSKSSSMVRQRAGETICHEIAHMWFGNLVTVAWWEHLWLKEGFATWASMVAVDHIYPDWAEICNFVLTSYMTALNSDALAPHPIEVPVRNPGEINEIFDAISYLKASSVIRMLADYIQVEPFRASLKKYLERHRLGAATTNDLWRAIEEETSLPVVDIMNGWTRTSSHPIVTVKENASGNVEISQKSVVSRNGSKGPLWRVPITCKTASNAQSTQRFLLDVESKAVPEMTSSEEWYLLNIDRAGFYRVMYPQRVWFALTHLIRKKDPALRPTDRAGLLSDAFELAAQDLLSANTLLDILLALGADSEIFSYIRTVLFAIKDIFCEDQECKRGWMSLAKRCANPIIEKYGAGHSASDNRLKHYACQLLIAAEDDRTSQAMEKLLHVYKKDVSSVAPEVVKFMLLAYVRRHEDPAYEDVLDMYHKATFNEAKVEFITVLGAGPRSETLRLRTLDFALREVRAQDAYYAIDAVASVDHKGRDLCWRWLRDRWDEVFEKFSGGSHVLPKLLSSVLAFNDASRISEIDAFFKDKDRSGYQSALNMRRISIEKTSSMLKCQQNTVRDWFRANSVQ